MQPQTVTLVVSALGICGTLTAAFGVHYFTRSWQREQWERDKRLQDYQDVLTAITGAYMALIRLQRIRWTESYLLHGAPEIDGPKEQSFRILRDRIFIADELGLYRVLEDWDAAVTNYEAAVENNSDTDGRKFGECFNELNSRLVRMALQAPKSPGRLLRWRNRRAIKKYRAKQCE